MKYFLLFLFFANVCESWRRGFSISPSSPLYPAFRLEIGITPMDSSKLGELGTYSTDPSYTNENNDYFNLLSEIKRGPTKHPANPKMDLNNDFPSKNASGLGRQSTYPENSDYTIVKTITTHPGMSSELGDLNRYLANPPHPNSVYPNMKFISGYSAVTSNKVLITDQNKLSRREESKTHRTPSRSSGVKQQRCMAPAHSPGPKCAALFIRYTYNPESNKCEQFIYGGCNLSPNNFETYEECKATCMAR